MHTTTIASRPLRADARSLLGRVLWGLSLSVGVTVAGLTSHMGVDSALGTYGVASVRDLQVSGAISVLVTVFVAVLLLLAGWLEPALRPRLPAVVGQLLAMFFLGVVWMMLGQRIEQLFSLSPPGGLAAAGTFVAIVLWMRLLSRGWQGAMAPRSW